MAMILRAIDRLEESLGHCDEAVVLAKKPNNLLDLAKAQTNRGVVLSQLNRWREAKQAHEQAQKVLSTTRDMRMYAGTQCNLSDVCRRLGDLEAAQRLADEALQLAVALDLHFEEALAHLNLGEALLECGQPRQARTEHLERAREVLDTREIAYLRAEVERGLAEAFAQEGQLEEAEQCARNAVRLAVVQESGSDEGSGLRVLAAVQRAKGQRAEAEATLRQGIELVRRHGPRFELGQAALELARLLAGDPARLEEAGQALQEARAIFAEAGARLALAEVEALAARFASDSSPAY
jgi:tetratricopeptide (TPR) repeat protein